jgi:hypothetical protein
LQLLNGYQAHSKFRNEARILQFKDITSVKSHVDEINT